MKLKQLGPNLDLLVTNHGYEFLYSYETPVAGFSPLIGLFKTNQHLSVTTSKHINKYLAGRDHATLSPQTIEQMGANIS